MEEPSQDVVPHTVAECVPSLPMVARQRSEAREELFSKELKISVSCRSCSGLLSRTDADAGEKNTEGSKGRGARRFQPIKWQVGGGLCGGCLLPRMFTTSVHPLVRAHL